MNCKQANNIPIINVLYKLGHKPTKCRNNEYWYISPFRNEKTASFKVDISKNLFYDHGEDFGGNTIDFIRHYFKCDISEALKHMPKLSFVFQPQQSINYDFKEQSNITIKQIKTLENKALIDYLKSRHILHNHQYLKEAYWQCNGKEYFGLAFENDKGGYELRNKYFKSCTSKAITTIKSDELNKPIFVFEGFFDYLSFCELARRYAQEVLNSIRKSNFIILNSISLVKQAITVLKSYTSIMLFLDNDDAGASASKEILEAHSQAKDCSELYRPYKDLNEFLVANENICFNSFHQECGWRN